MDRFTTGRAVGATSTGGPSRRHLLTALLAFPLSGCAVVALRAGAGDDGTAPGGGADGGAGGRPTGRIVLKDSEVNVVDAASGTARTFPAADAFHPPGVGVSRSGVIGDVWGYFGAGSESWHVTVRDLAGTQVADYTVGGSLGFPTSAATIDPTASRICWSVDELRSADGDAPRIERVYVYDLRSGTLLGRIDERAEPVPVGTGELLVRNEDRIHVYGKDLDDKGPIGLTASPRPGAFDVSPDGRYVVAEENFRLYALDRTTGERWKATNEFHRSHLSPAFSPDGRWLAFLRAGEVASQYLAVIRFRPGATHEVTDDDELRSPSGDFYGGTGRIGWAA